MRFLHVDRFLSIEVGKSVRAVKCVSLADEYLRGHFPRKPLVPGTVWVEAMLQTLGWLVVRTNDFRVLPLFSMLEDLVVPPALEPGQLVEIHGELISQNPKGSMGRAWATLDGVEVASAARVIYAHFPIDPARLKRMLPDLGGAP